LDENQEKEYVAISLYYVDGPVSAVDLFAKVGFVGGPTFLDDPEIGRERKLSILRSEPTINF
jgi:hypothetical protein